MTIRGRPSTSWRRRAAQRPRRSPRPRRRRPAEAPTIPRRSVGAFDELTMGLLRPRRHWRRRQKAAPAAFAALKRPMAPRTLRQRKPTTEDSRRSLSLTAPGRRATPLWRRRLCSVRGDACRDRRGAERRASAGGGGGPLGVVSGARRGRRRPRRSADDRRRADARGRRVGCVRRCRRGGRRRRQPRRDVRLPRDVVVRARVSAGRRDARGDAPTAFAAFQEPAADGAESPGTTEPAVDDDAPAAGDSMSTSGDASRPPPPTAIVCKPCAPAATDS